MISWIYLGPKRTSASCYCQGQIILNKYFGDKNCNGFRVSLVCISFCLVHMLCVGKRQICLIVLCQFLFSKKPGQCK